jgi:N-succinyldiaminopimelate aminotransferase
MPRFPAISPIIAAIQGSVFSGRARKLRESSGEIYPFHIGDTWMEPPVGTRMEDLDASDEPGMHRYSPVQGRPELLQALAERISKRQKVRTTRSNLLITAGATGGLGAAIGAIVEPGEEVLVVAPYWPLITGIIRSFRAQPVPVPLFGVADSPESAVETVTRHVTDKTVAIYWNTPNNPTGQILPANWLTPLVALATEKDLWILADEVYEDYAFSGTHTYTRPLAPERTFSVHSFSKAYGMAGNRCGYVVGPSETVAELRKVSTHTFYSAPTAAQIAACRALSHAGDQWIAEARRHYEAAGRAAADRLGVKPADGGTFLFLDVSDHLRHLKLSDLLEQFVEHRVLVAPGPSFGPFPNHIRICFTSAPPEKTQRGIEILARLLGR